MPVFAVFAVSAVSRRMASSAEKKHDQLRNQKKTNREQEVPRNGEATPTRKQLRLTDLHICLNICARQINRSARRQDLHEACGAIRSEVDLEGRKAN